MDQEKREVRPAESILPAHFSRKIKIKVDKNKDKDTDTEIIIQARYTEGIPYWDILAKVSKEGHSRSCYLFPQ
jgi:hypothetical protein